MPSGKRPANVGEVAAALKYRYADFSHYNLKDPLDELLFIICSTKTDEANYRASFEALKAAFPTPNQLAQATAEYIAKPIAIGGLSNQKSKAIRTLLDAVVARFGAPTLEPLGEMGDRDAEAFLTSLPNVGKKVARCVMMYAFDRKAFSCGYALLAYRSAVGLGQADTKRPALRAVRHGPPAIQNTPGVSLLATREYDFAGA